MGSNTGKAIAAVSIVCSVAAGVIVTWRRRRRNTDIPTPPQGEPDEIIRPLVLNESHAPEYQYEWIRHAAKAELHCHLNGSVRRSTLKDILGCDDGVCSGTVHTIQDAFTMFKSVYEAVNSESTLRRIVRECLSDAIDDNIRYLELRTTPRKLEDIASRRDYVRVVIDEISHFGHLNAQRPLLSFPEGKIAVRLILTIDRSQPLSTADQTVDIALRYSDWVVGIDFAGNPSIGSFEDFAAVFARARGHGLFVTVHTSEIRGVETETDAILNFRPNRLGHFLFPTEAQLVRAVESGIAIESCPTSNICAMSGRSPVDGDVSEHSVLQGFLRTNSHLLTINTDDPGVFNCRLTDELCAIARTFKLQSDQLKEIITQSGSHAFLSKTEKEALVFALRRG
jgi:adenosine deaminase